MCEIYECKQLNVKRFQSLFFIFPKTELALRGSECCVSFRWVTPHVYPPPCWIAEPLDLHCLACWTATALIAEAMAWIAMAVLLALLTALVLLTLLALLALLARLFLVSLRLMLLTSLALLTLFALFTAGGEGGGAGVHALASLFLKLVFLQALAGGQPSESEHIRC